MDALDDPNVYTDITVPVGCDLVWGVQLQPWDATGTSASFVVSGTPYAMSITVQNAGDTDVLSQFNIHLTPTQLAALGLNVSGNTASYVIRWTDTSGAIWPLGYGTIIAQ